MAGHRGSFMFVAEFYFSHSKAINTLQLLAAKRESDEATGGGASPAAVSASCHTLHHCMLGM